MSDKYDEYSPEFRMRVVLDSLRKSSEESVADVAVRHGVDPQQLYIWRNQYRNGIGVFGATDSKGRGYSVEVVDKERPGQNDGKSEANELWDMLEQVSDENERLKAALERANGLVDTLLRIMERHPSG